MIVFVRIMPKYISANCIQSFLLRANLQFSPLLIHSHFIPHKFPWKVSVFQNSRHFATLITRDTPSPLRCHGGAFVFLHVGSGLPCSTLSRHRTQIVTVRDTHRSFTLCRMLCSAALGSRRVVWRRQPHAGSTAR